VFKDEREEKRKKDRQDPLKMLRGVSEIQGAHGDPFCFYDLFY